MGCWLAQGFASTRRESTNRSRPHPIDWIVFPIEQSQHHQLNDRKQNIARRIIWINEVVHCEQSWSWASFTFPLKKQKIPSIKTTFSGKSMHTMFDVIIQPPFFVSIIDDQTLVQVYPLPSISISVSNIHLSIHRSFLIFAAIFFHRIKAFPMANV